jgi:ABC-type Co2+ transport system permease subunit
LRNKKFIANKAPIEIHYLIKKYNLDINKVKYRRLLHMIGLVMSLNISLSITIVSFLKNSILQMLLGLLILVPLSMIVFNLFGIYFKKKGLIKND